MKKLNLVYKISVILTFLLFTIVLLGNFDKFNYLKALTFPFLYASAFVFLPISLILLFILIYKNKRLEMKKVNLFAPLIYLVIVSVFFMSVILILKTQIKKNNNSIIESYTIEAEPPIIE